MNYLIFLNCKILAIANAQQKANLTFSETTPMPLPVTYFDMSPCNLGGSSTYTDFKYSENSHPPLRTCPFPRAVGHSVLCFRVLCFRPGTLYLCGTTHSSDKWPLQSRLLALMEQHSEQDLFALGEPGVLRVWSCTSPFRYRRTSVLRVGFFEVPLACAISVLFVLFYVESPEPAHCGRTT